MRLNGSHKGKSSDEAKVEIDEDMQLRDLLKIACKHFGCKENYKIAKLYSKNGIQLFKDDINCLGHGDILYLAAKGKWRAYDYSLKNSLKILEVH